MPGKHNAGGCSCCEEPCVEVAAKASCRCFATNGAYSSQKNVEVTISGISCSGCGTSEVVLELTCGSGSSGTYCSGNVTVDWSYTQTSSANFRIVTIRVTVFCFRTDAGHVGHAVQKQRDWTFHGNQVTVDTCTGGTPTGTTVSRPGCAEVTDVTIYPNTSCTDLNHIPFLTIPCSTPMTCDCDIDSVTVTVADIP